MEVTLLVDAIRLKRDNLIRVDGELYQVVETSFNRMQQRRAIVTARIKNVKTGAVLEKKFRSQENVEEAYLEKREMEYLYRDGEFGVFMDTETYEQQSMEWEGLGDAGYYLVPNIRVMVRFCEGASLGVQLPTTVDIAVKECDPALKGATLTAQYKPAVLETGLKITVPPFVNQGDMISVDTREGKYLSRAQSAKE